MTFANPGSGGRPPKTETINITRRLNMNSEIQLGDRVKHRITGFLGIVTGSANYVTGCTQHLVISPDLKPDGESRFGWFDAIMLEILDTNPLHLAGTPAAKLTPGGPLTSSAPGKTNGETPLLLQPD